jgi:hypothetical protein
MPPDIQRRVGDFHVLRAEDHARCLDQHQRQAPGGEQGFQRAAVEPANHRALEQHADRGSGEEGHRHGGQQVPVELVGEEAAEQALHGIGGIGADHQQFAVGHVDHAHHTVGNRQAQRGQQQDGAEAEAGEYAADVFGQGQAILHFQIGAEGSAAHFGLGFVGRFGLCLEGGLGVGVGAGRQRLCGSNAQLWIGVLEGGQRVRLNQQGADLRLGFAITRLGQHRRHRRIDVAGDFLDRLETHHSVRVNQFEYRQRAFELAAHAVVERDFLALVILQTAVGELLQYRQRLGLGGQRELLDRGDLVVGFLGR